MAAAVLLLVLMAAALSCAVFFAAAETATFQIGVSDVKAIARSERVRKALEWVVSHRRRTLVTVLLLDLVTSIFYMNLGQALAAEVGRSFGPEGRLPVDFAVLLVLVLAEVLSKTVALQRPRAIAAMSAVPLVVAERVLRVPRVVLTAISDALMRLIPLKKEEGDVTPAELQEVLKVAVSRGQLGMDEHEWLRALVELDQVQVKEIIVPRVEMVAFDVRETREEFLELFVKTRHNKIPVHEGNVDRIKGYLSGKDVLSHPGRPLRELIRPIIFIPETASIASAMQQMQSGARRLAIVVDEYGGTEGLVTQEDLVESVVGDLRDESDESWEPVRELEAGTYEVDAALPVHALRRLVGREAGRRGIATVGGLVSALLERVPRKGDRVTFGKITIEVASMRGKRPHRLVIRHEQRKTTERGA
jgi:putative hemolysin